MQFLLVAILAVVYSLAHFLSAKVFHFAEIAPHIQLIDFPAFLRLFHVLVLGLRDGTLATLLGGALFMLYFSGGTLFDLGNVACSAGGPLLALVLFKLFFKRPNDLSSLRDLTTLTLLSAAANSLLHHMLWAQLAPHLLEHPIQMVWMMVGDIMGTLLGAYIMRCCLQKFRLVRAGF